LRTPLRSSALRTIDRSCLDWPTLMTPLEVAVGTYNLALLHLSKQGTQLNADMLTNSEVLVPVNMVERETDRISLTTVCARVG